MTEVIPRKPPLPVAQTFLTCHEIFYDQQKCMNIIIGPISHVSVKQFPTHVRLSVFTEFSGCHGSYLPRLMLRDAADEVVWGWTVPKPFVQEHPLAVHRHVFADLMLAVPRPGRYVLVLQLNDEEVAQRRLGFGLLEADRP
jgi:hypothetical protein